MKGLYSKYTVIENETGEEVGGCFVLRPKKDKAARVALKAYAQATDNIQLSEDIIAWLALIENITTVIKVEE